MGSCDMSCKPRDHRMGCYLGAAVSILIIAWDAWILHLLVSACWREVAVNMSHYYIGG